MVNKQFFKKIIGEKISINVPMKTLAEFDQVSVKETLIETRIDQSIALLLHTTNMFRPEEAPPKPFLNNSIQSPPTSDILFSDISHQGHQHDAATSTARVGLYLGRRTMVVREGYGQRPDYHP